MLSVVEVSPSRPKTIEIPIMKIVGSFVLIDSSTSARGGALCSVYLNVYAERNRSKLFLVQQQLKSRL